MKKKIDNNKYSCLYLVKELTTNQKNLFLKISFFSLFSFCFMHCYSQNDTIYLKDNFIIFQNKEYNKYLNNEKSGNWIEFEIISDSYTVSLSSGVNEHWHEIIRKKYRPLKENEYNGMKIKIKENTDTITEIVYHEIIYHEIFEKIPPDNCFIVAKGSYKNNLKNDKWIFYYYSGKIKKEIYYSDGLPQMGFKIYREDGSVMIDVQKKSSKEWNVCKFSACGKIINCEIKKIEEFIDLY